MIIARDCDIIEEDVILCGLEVEEENNIQDEVKEKEKEDSTNMNQEKKDMTEDLEKGNASEVNSNDDQTITDEDQEEKL